MIPIISHSKEGGKGYTFNNFKSHFLRICESHREEKRALAFAFILYDMRNPQVAKALNDPLYWQALNDISGKFLSVFSFHTMPHHKKNQRKNNSNSIMTGYMTSITLDDFEDSRSMLENYFELDKNIQLPAILFFQVSSSEIIGSKLVQLTQEKTEDVFIEIKKIISSAADSVSNVANENHRNDHAITSSVINKIKSVKGFLGIFGA